LGVIVGLDFFTVEVVTVLGLVRYHVLFVIDIGSRLVEVVGLARNPGGEWMMQMVRNLIDIDDGFLRGKRYLILERDPLYTKELRQMLRGAGVKPLLLPARSPNLKGYASHCTSLRRFARTSGNRRRSWSLRPCSLAGGLSPGSSYKHSFLSL